MVTPSLGALIFALVFWRYADRGSIRPKLVYEVKTNMVKTQPKDPPPRQLIYWQRALLWHSLGFLTILILTWCDSLFDMMHALFGFPPQRPEELPEISVKLGVIILLWILSGYKLYLIVSRLSYLEKFLHVCSWCRKIEYNSSWLSLEEHFLRQTGHKATHGICPECAQRMKIQTEQFQPETIAD